MEEECVIAGIEYQAPTMGACGGELCPAAVQAWEQINHKMHAGMMNLEYTGDAEVDFVRGMIPHHLGAVDMCEGLLDNLTCTEISDIDTLDGLLHFCNHVQLEQEIEVTGMRAWLEQKNLSEVVRCPTSSGSMPLTSVRSVSGDNLMSMEMMESCGNLTALSSQKLVEVNHKMHKKMAVQYSCDHLLDFVRQMAPHHAGAVDMCDILMETTEDTYLIELCANITLTQRAEIVWMVEWLEARDYDAIAPCDEDCNVDEVMSTAPEFCEDTLSTSSFCHGIAGNSQDGYCRCDEETFASNNFMCGEATWVDGFGLFLPQVFCRRSCGLCTSDTRPIWLPGCMDDNMNHVGMNHGGTDHEHEGMNHVGMDHSDHIGPHDTMEFGDQTENSSGSANDRSRQYLLLTLFLPIFATFEMS